MYTSENQAIFIFRTHITFSLFCFDPTKYVGNLKPNTTKRGNSFLKTQPLKRNILSRINSVKSFISSWIGCDLSLQYVRQLLLIYSAPAAFCFAISFCIWASISCIRRNWKGKKKDHFQTFIFGRRHLCSTKIWHQTSRLFNRAVFNWLSKVTTRVRFPRLVIGLKDSRQFFNQWESKPRQTAPCTRDFSRATSELQVIARNCDWFIALFTPVVIGRNNCFGFGFSTVIWKPLNPNCHRKKLMLRALALCRWRRPNADEVAVLKLETSASFCGGNLTLVWYKILQFFFPTDTIWQRRWEVNLLHLLHQAREKHGEANSFGHEAPLWRIIALTHITSWTTKGPNP